MIWKNVSPGSHVSHPELPAASSSKPGWRRWFARRLRTACFPPVRSGSRQLRVRLRRDGSLARCAPGRFGRKGRKE